MRKLAHGLKLPAAMLFAVGLATSCGGGGDDPPPSNPTGPTRCVSYMSAAPAAGEVAGRRGAASTCSMLALEVVVAGVNGVFAADFKVDYDPSVLSFTNGSVSDAGSLLKSGPVMTSVQATTDGQTVTVGITRLDLTAPGVDFPANGDLLLTLFFQKATNSAVQSSNVTFTDETLRDSQTPPQPIGGVTWIDGAASIQ